MKITPLEIRQKHFEKSFRGYDKEEVDAFLSAMSKEWERVQREGREVKKRLEKSEQELQRLKDMEASFFKTLKTVENTGVQAKKEAELNLKEAKAQADNMLREAQRKSQDMLKKNEEKIYQTLRNLQKELRKVQESHQSMEHRKNKLVANLRTFAENVLEGLERFEQKDEVANFHQEMVKAKSLLHKLVDSPSAEPPREDPSHTSSPSSSPPPSPPKTDPNLTSEKDKGSFFDRLT